MDLATLRSRLGRRVGFDGNTARLDGFINDAVQMVHGHRSDWAWARRTLQFQTLAPQSGTTAVFTNASRAVTSLTAGGTTRTGARLLAPDGIVYDVTAPAVAVTTASLTTPYTGATSAVGGDAWKLYFDTYPLPPDCSEIEAIVATGNGWEYPVPQQSLLPQRMKRLSAADNESYPTCYALEAANPIPAPWVTPVVADDGGGTLPDGTYTFWYCFRNRATGELGPLSAPASVTTGSLGADTGRIDISALQILQDYGKRVYRSVAGGSDPLFLTDVNPATTTELNNEATDIQLGIDSTNSDFVGAHPEHGHVQKIRFWPPPDDEYVVSLTYFALQPVLYKANDVPMLPARFHQVVLDYAQGLYMREQENHGAAARIEGRAMAMLQSMSVEQNADPGTVVQIGRGAPTTDEDLRGSGRWGRWVNQ